MLLRDPWLRTLAMLGCAIAGFYLVGLVWQLIQQFADIVLLFFLAWLLAFVLEPVVATAEHYHVPRVPAIAATFVILLLLILSFYFMVDGARLAEAFIRSLPRRLRDDTRFLIANIHRAFAGF